MMGDTTDDVGRSRGLPETEETALRRRLKEAE